MALPLLIWWVGAPVIIGLVSVQVKLKLALPTGTELGKNTNLSVPGPSLSDCNNEPPEKLFRPNQILKNTRSLLYYNM